MASGRIVLAFLAVLGLICTGVRAQEAAAAEAVTAEADKDAQNKLLPLTEMEAAFKRAVANRNRLVLFINQEEEKVKASESDDEKKEIRGRIGEARKSLQTLATAMDVVFGLGGGLRQYEYNEVNSTIFLRVGTAEEVFVRAIRARDVYAKVVSEQTAALEKETDEEAKKAIQARIDEATRRYQLIAASLHLIYGVTPKRDYLYNPKNSTLYLKVSENELEKIKEQVEKLQEERRAKAPAEGGN